VPEDCRVGYPSEVREAAGPIASPCPQGGMGGLGSRGKCNDPWLMYDTYIKEILTHYEFLAIMLMQERWVPPSDKPLAQNSLGLWGFRWTGPRRPRGLPLRHNTSPRIHSDADIRGCAGFSRAGVGVVFLGFSRSQSDSEMRLILPPTWVSFSSMRS
jgi:hypothetical protein